MTAGDDQTSAILGEGNGGGTTDAGERTGNDDDWIVHD